MQCHLSEPLATAPKSHAFLPFSICPFECISLPMIYDLLWRRQNVPDECLKIRARFHKAFLRSLPAPHLCFGSSMLLLRKQWSICLLVFVTKHQQQQQQQQHAQTLSAASALSLPNAETSKLALQEPGFTHSNKIPSNPNNQLRQKPCNKTCDQHIFHFA